MKPIALIPLTVLASVAASYVVCRATLPSEPAAVQASEAGGAELAALTRECAALRAEQRGQRELLQRLEQLATAQTARAGGESRVPLAEIEAAIARALAARGDAPAPAEKVAEVPQPRRTAAQALEELLALDDWNASSKLWAELRDQGLVAEVVALFEARAKERANDPEAQVELGSAYLQKLFTVPAGPEQGVWAGKADQAFDAALKLDPQHWDARFSKAVSLSNWPAFLGKQGEAAKHFETLIEQQNAGPARPQHAQTYFFLGNLYQSMGRGEQALATWRTGSQLFPDNSELRKQLETAGGPR